MAKCGQKYLVNYLKSEYGVSRCGPRDLVRALREEVNHALSEVNLDDIESSNRLKNVSEDVLYLAAKSIYIEQDFKKALL